MSSTPVSPGRTSPLFVREPIICISASPRDPFIDHVNQLQKDCAQVNHPLTEGESISIREGHEILRIDLTIKGLFSRKVQEINNPETQDAIHNLIGLRMSLLGQGIRIDISPAMQLQQAASSLLKGETSPENILKIFEEYQSDIYVSLNSITQWAYSKNATYSEESIANALTEGLITNDQLAEALLDVARDCDQYSFKEIDRIAQLLQGSAKVTRTALPVIDSSSSSSFTSSFSSSMSFPINETMEQTESFSSSSSSSSSSSFSSSLTTTSSPITETIENYDELTTEAGEIIWEIENVLDDCENLAVQLNFHPDKISVHWDEAILRVDLTIANIFSRIAITEDFYFSGFKEAIGKLIQARFQLLDKNFRFTASRAMQLQKTASDLLNAHDLEENHSELDTDSEPLTLQSATQAPKALGDGQKTVDSQVKDLLLQASELERYSSEEIEHITRMLQGYPKTTNVLLTRMENFPSLSSSSSSSSSSSLSSTTTSSLTMEDPQVFKEELEKLRSSEDPYPENSSGLSNETRAIFDINIAYEFSKNAYKNYFFILEAYSRSISAVETFKRNRDELLEQIEDQIQVVNDQDAEVMKRSQTRDSLDSELEGHRKKCTELQSAVDAAASAAENAQNTKAEQEIIYKANKTNKAQWQVYSAALKSLMACNQQLLLAEKELEASSKTQLDLEEQLHQAYAGLESSKIEHENASKKLLSLKSELQKLESDLEESMARRDTYTKMLDETEKGLDKATDLAKTRRHYLRNSLTELAIQPNLRQTFQDLASFKPKEAFKLAILRNFDTRKK